MTSLERLETALRGGRPDRVPVSPHGWGHVDPETDLGEEMLDRLDMLLPVGSGASPFWGSQVDVTVTHRGADTVCTLRTPGGELRQVHRRTAITSATVEFYCKSAADLEAVAGLPFQPAEPLLLDYEHWTRRAAGRALTMVGIPTGICVAAELLSPEDLCLLWADAPALLTDVVAEAHRRILAFTARCCDLGARAFRIIGGEYATTQLGPRGYEALCVGFDRELCDLIRARGALAYYHNHGAVRRFLPQFRRVAMHALDPLEAPPYGDADLAECKAALGEICLVGNLDDMEQIEQLDHDTLRRLAEERLRQAGESGFVLGGTASGTYTERGARGFLALLDVVS